MKAVKLLEVKPIPLEMLVVDLDVYPRHAVESFDVGRYVQAFRAGSRFPPIRVEARTNRVVDGVHRLRAAERVGLAEIEAELYEFEDEAELFFYATLWNSQHGKPLKPFDQARCLVIFERLKVPPERAAEAMCVTLERVESLRQSRIRRVQVSPVSGPGPERVIFEPVPVKRIVAEVTRDTVTPQQVAAQGLFCGWGGIQYLKAMVEALRNDLLLVDSRTLGLVRELVEVAEAWLRRHAAAGEKAS